MRKPSRSRSVRPFVKSNKNDYKDAEAIAEAVQRPTMRFVPIKTQDQLDLQALHRVRDRLVSRRCGQPDPGVPVGTRDHLPPPRSSTSRGITTLPTFLTCSPYKPLKTLPRLYPPSRRESRAIIVRPSCTTRSSCRHGTSSIKRRRGCHSSLQTTTRSIRQAPITAATVPNNRSGTSASPPASQVVRRSNRN